MYFGEVYLRHSSAAAWALPVPTPSSANPSRGNRLRVPPLANRPFSFAFLAAP
jgi:hypothetical protein